jgi:hypothetical protein
MESSQPGRSGRPLRSAAALACALLVPILLAAPARASAPAAYLRLAHLSPDTPAVDVTVTAFGRPNWTSTLKGVGYGDISGYQRIEPGTYTVAMRPAGADPASPAVISATLDAVDGKAYTVAGLGKFASLALRVLDDDIGLPPAGQAKMRVVNAAPKAGELTIRRDGQIVLEHAQFGQASPYALVQAGQTTLDLTPALAKDTTVPVTLDAGGVYSVLVLERNGVLSALVREDAKGAKVIPTGPVETGLGAMAAQPNTALLGPLGMVLLIAAALASGLLATTVRRHRRA